MLVELCVHKVYMNSWKALIRNADHAPPSLFPSSIQRSCSKGFVNYKQSTNGGGGPFIHPLSLHSWHAFHCGKLWYDIYDWRRRRRADRASLVSFLVSACHRSSACINPHRTGRLWLRGMGRSQKFPLWKSTLALTLNISKFTCADFF